MPVIPLLPEKYNHEPPAISTPGITRVAVTVFFPPKRSRAPTAIDSTMMVAIMTEPPNLWVVVRRSLCIAMPQAHHWNCELALCSGECTIWIRVRLGQEGWCDADILLATARRQRQAG